jgi:hypothetical protein
MTSLGDAWAWYQATRESLWRLRRLADKYWPLLPWDGPLGGDDRFRDLEGPEASRSAALGLEHFDDIAVLVLFSVFEAEVRSQVLGDIRAECDSLQHPSLLHAAAEAQTAIAEGSFFRVLEPYKGRATPELVEEVNQVRRYRNWVAHGRRSTRPSDIRPEVAFDRLTRFLAVLRPTAGA